MTTTGEALPGLPARTAMRTKDGCDAGPDFQGGEAPRGRKSGCRAHLSQRRRRPKVDRRRLSGDSCLYLDPTRAASQSRSPRRRGFALLAPLSGMWLGDELEGEV